MESDHEDDGRETAARKAWLIRDHGHSYTEIADRLGCSKGKAHHLVRAASDHQHELASELPRPPGKPKEPTPERAEQLFGRLELDFARVVRLLRAHFDADYDPHSVGERLEPISATFASSHSLMKRAVESARRAQPPAIDPASACAELERTFSEAVAIAADCDRTLAEEIGPDFLLAVFRRDLHELGEILGLGPPPEWREEPPPLGETEGGPAEPRQREMQLDADGRRLRNERVIAARLAGVPAADLAETHSISERQIGRIMAEHRQHYEPSESAHAVWEAGLRSLDQEFESLDRAEEAAQSPRERSRIHRRRMETSTKLTALLCAGGKLAPEIYSTKQNVKAAVTSERLEWVAGTNAGVRRLLEESGVDQHIIEAAVDEICRSPDQGAD